MKRFSALLALMLLAPSPTVPLALQIPSSGIHIDQIGFEDIDDTQSGPFVPGTSYECLSFTNLDVRAATEVAFDFAWAQSDGGRENDEFDLASATDLVPYGTTSGTFVQGVQTGATKKGHPSLGFCRVTNSGWARGKPTENLATFVEGVQYQDGTSWRLVPPVDGIARNEPGSPATLSTVQTNGSSTPYECATIENTSSKTIKHVQITFRHDGLDGRVLGEELLDVRALTTAAMVVKNNCRSFTGAMDPSVRTYANMAIRGASLPAPRITYKGQYSTLSAYVDEVDFADGTKWPLPAI